MRQVVSTLAQYEGALQIWHVALSSGGYGGQDFVETGDRDWALQDRVFEMYDDLKQIASLSVFPIMDSSLPSAGQFDVEVAISSSHDAATMLPYAQQLVKAAEESGLFMFADTDLRVDLVQARIDIDKQRVADLGMSLSDISNQIGLLNSEAYVTRFDDRGRAYRVIPKVAKSERTSPEAILDMPIRTPTGELIPLGALATLERVTAPRALTRFQQKNAFKIYGGVIPGTTKEQGLAFIEKTAAAILPNGYVLDYTGESREIRSEGNTLLGVLALAMALVFFVLSIQFNSFRDPLIILLGSIPLALFAALVITFSNLTTINIYSQVGLITLAGLVAKERDINRRVCQPGSARWPRQDRRHSRRFGKPPAPSSNDHWRNGIRPLSAHSRVRSRFGSTQQYWLYIGGGYAHRHVLYAGYVTCDLCGLSV